MTELSEKKANVLIVDDEAQFLEVISQRLAARGVKVDTVTSGEDAFDKIKTGADFDAVVLDLAMPGMGGIETLKRIKTERPDALLPNLGGQSGLNLSSELAQSGALEEYGVKVIGVEVDAIKRGEDRLAFKDTMNQLGIEMPKSAIALTVEEAERIADGLGYPVVIRPAYTMGGWGGGLVYNLEELRTIAARGLSASLVGQILVEESVLGWEELELEVV